MGERPTIEGETMHRFLIGVLSIGLAAELACAQTEVTKYLRHVYRLFSEVKPFHP